MYAGNSRNLFDWKNNFNIKNVTCQCVLVQNGFRNRGQK